MKLSLCVSFYLRHNLGGYTVGTTARFPVEIVAESHGSAHSTI
jgi:hypothetical protein